MKGSKTDSLAGCRAPLYLPRDNRSSPPHHVMLLCLRTCLSTTTYCTRLDLCPSSLTTKIRTDSDPRFAKSGCAFRFWLELVLLALRGNLLVKVKANV